MPDDVQNSRALLDELQGIRRRQRTAVLEGDGKAYLKAEREWAQHTERKPELFSELNFRIHKAVEDGFQLPPDMVRLTDAGFKASLPAGMSTQVYTDPRFDTYYTARGAEQQVATGLALSARSEEDRLSDTDKDRVTFAKEVLGAEVIPSPAVMEFYDAHKATLRDRVYDPLPPTASEEEKAGIQAQLGPKVRSAAMRVLQSFETPQQANAFMSTFGALVPKSASGDSVDRIAELAVVAKQQAGQTPTDYFAIARRVLPPNTAKQLLDANSGDVTALTSYVSAHVAAGAGPEMKRVKDLVDLGGADPQFFNPTVIRRIREAQIPGRFGIKPTAAQEQDLRAGRLLEDSIGKYEMSLKALETGDVETARALRVGAVLGIGDAAGAIAPAISAGGTAVSTLERKRVAAKVSDVAAEAYVEYTSSITGETEQELAKQEEAVAPLVDYDKYAALDPETKVAAGLTRAITEIQGGELAPKIVLAPGESPETVRPEKYAPGAERIGMTQEEAQQRVAGLAQWAKYKEDVASFQQSVGKHLARPPEKIASRVAEAKNSLGHRKSLLDAQAAMASPWLNSQREYDQFKVTLDGVEYSPSAMNVSFDQFESIRAKYGITPTRGRQASAVLQPGLQLGMAHASTAAAKELISAMATGGGEYVDDAGKYRLFARPVAPKLYVGDRKISVDTTKPQERAMLSDYASRFGHDAIAARAKQRAAVSAGWEKAEAVRTYPTTYADEFNRLDMEFGIPKADVLMNQAARRLLLHNTRVDQARNRTTLQAIQDKNTSLTPGRR